MNVSFVQAERLTFGNFRYRLTVQHRIGWFHYRRTYEAKISPPFGFIWYRNGEWVWNGSMAETLTSHLNDALADGLVTTQKLTECPVWVPAKTRKQEPTT